MKIDVVKQIVSQYYTIYYIISGFTVSSWKHLVYCLMLAAIQQIIIAQGMRVKKATCKMY